MYSLVYLLCSVRRQELEVISFVAGDATREENGIGFCVILQEPDHILGFLERHGIVGEPLVVTMLSHGKSNILIVPLESY